MLWLLISMPTSQIQMHIQPIQHIQDEDGNKIGVRYSLCRERRHTLRVPLSASRCVDTFPREIR